MTEEEKENWIFCRYRMKEEGFHYCFTCYSNWDEIKDEKFHELRKNYLDASKALEKYISKKAEQSDQ